MYYHSFFPWTSLLWIIVVIAIFCGPWSWRRQYWRERRGRWDRNGQSGSGSGAEDILKERFAKGEITEKEYLERMNVLKK